MNRVFVSIFSKQFSKLNDNFENNIVIPAIYINTTNLPDLIENSDSQIECKIIQQYGEQNE
jgi:hypothetical protein